MKKTEPHELTAYERWELPVVKGNVVNNNKLVIDQEPVFEVKQDVLDTLKANAHDTGLKEGKEIGYNTGVEEVNNHISYLDKIIHCLEEPLKNLTFPIEQDLMEMITIIVKKIIQQELTTKPEHILTITQLALQALPVSTRDVKLTLHPQDIELIKNNALIQNLDLSCELVANENISRGGCSIQTYPSSIDATLESRISNVFSQVFKDKLDEHD